MSTVFQRVQNCYGQVVVAQFGHVCGSELWKLIWEIPFPLPKITLWNGAFTSLGALPQWQTQVVIGCPGDRARPVVTSFIVGCADLATMARFLWSCWCPRVFVVVCCSVELFLLIAVDTLSLYLWELFQGVSSIESMGCWNLSFVWKSCRICFIL